MADVELRMDFIKNGNWTYYPPEELAERELAMQQAKEADIAPSFGKSVTLQ